MSSTTAIRTSSRARYVIDRGGTVHWAFVNTASTT